MVNHPDLVDIDAEIRECDDFADTALTRLTTTAAQPAQSAYPRSTSSPPVGSERRVPPALSSNRVIEVLDSPPTASGTAASPEQAQPELHPYAGSIFKLDITPEEFDGDRLQYREFMSQFLDWVRKDARATNIDRLQALCKLLKGEPRELVWAFEITEANYDVGLKLLEDNFGQINVERQRVMASLINHPDVKSQKVVTASRLSRPLVPCFSY